MKLSYFIKASRNLPGCAQGFTKPDGLPDNLIDDLMDCLIDDRKGQLKLARLGHKMVTKIGPLMLQWAKAGIALAKKLAKFIRFWQNSPKSSNIHQLLLKIVCKQT